MKVQTIFISRRQLACFCLLSKSNCSSSTRYGGTSDAKEAGCSAYLGSSLNSWRF